MTFTSKEKGNKKYYEEFMYILVVIIYLKKDLKLKYIL